MLSSRGPCYWNTLPVELQAKVLQLCDFKHKVTFQLVCKAWSKMLTSPQDCPYKVWGEVSLDLYELFSNATLGWTDKALHKLRRPAVQGFVQPICRWLAIRAFGMQYMYVKVPNIAYYNIPVSEHANAALDRYVTGFLKALVSALRGKFVPLNLELAGRPSCVKLLSNQSFMRKLSGWHYIDALELSDLSARMPLDTFVHICSLTDLAQLRLHGSLDGTASIDAIPPAISRLTSLRALDIAVAFPFARLLEVPPELTTLQGLAHVTLQGCFNPLPLLSRLPNLKGLSIGGNVGEDAISFPSDLGHLTRLTFFELESVIFDSSFHRLSELRDLKHLWYRRDELVTGADDSDDSDLDDFYCDKSARSLFPAMHTLRSLQTLMIHNAEVYMGVPVTVFSVLDALTSLSLRNMHLPMSVSRDWQQLHRLSLHSNNLVVLHSPLRNLTALTALEVCDQSLHFQFTAPLAFLQGMQALQLLDLRQNRRRCKPSAQHTWTPESMAFLADAETRILPSLLQAVKFQY